MPHDAFAIIAHRGDNANAPENTIAAFDLALERGFPAFETDAQLLTDGTTVVLIHGETFERTTNGHGRVADASPAAVQALDAGSWFSPEFAGEHVPMLEEVLIRYKGRAHIHLELKSEQLKLPAAVAALVQQHGWDYDGASPSGDQSGGLAAVPGLTVTSFHLEQLVRSKQLLPRVQHAWLIQEWSDDVAATAHGAGIECICPRANALTSAAVAAAKAQGFGVRAWGVKSLELLKHVVKCGADGATVDWPLKAKAFLAQNS